KLLTTGQSLHVWIDGCIARQEVEIDDLQKEADRHDKAEERIKRQEDSPQRDKQLRDIAAKLNKVQGKLEVARRTHYYSLILRKYIYLLLPAACFLTPGYVSGLVVVGVALKGVFEFFQESLVGSVVNLSLFDLRNRFYRNVIHLDVDQFSEQGTSELMARFTNDMEVLGTGKKTL